MSPNVEVPESPRPPTEEELKLQTLAVELELKRKQLADFGKPAAQPRKPWWVVAVEFLGLPAAVLGLVVAFTTASGNRASEKKTEAETAQIQASLAKAAETNKLASDLAAKEKEGPKAFDQAVAQNADKIKDALDQLQQLEAESARINVQRAVLKFVLLWILFSVMALIFDVIKQAWNTGTSSLLYFLTTWLAKGENSADEKRLERARRRREQFNRYAPGFFIALGPLPEVLLWSIQLSIFFVLVGPLFNEIAASFGSGTTFNDVLREASHLHIGAMLSMMRHILFSQ